MVNASHIGGLDNLKDWLLRRDFVLYYSVLTEVGDRVRPGTRRCPGASERFFMTKMTAPPN
ncbi:MAG: hypothetical protein AB4352_17500 [Hormoscilla sp.]